MQQQRWAERESQAGVLGSRSVGQRERRGSKSIGEKKQGQRKRGGSMNVEKA